MKKKRTKQNQSAVIASIIVLSQQALISQQQSKHLNRKLVNTEYQAFRKIQPKYDCSVVLSYTLS